MSLVLHVANTSRLLSVQFTGLRVFNKFMASATSSSKKKGLVLGVYSSNNNGDSQSSTDKVSSVVKLTNAGTTFNEKVENRLVNLLNIAGIPKKNEARVFYDVSQDFPALAVVNLGPHPEAEKAAFERQDELEERDNAKDNIRAAVAAGAKALRNAGFSQLSIDPCTDAECAAEGAALTLWQYQDLKSPSKRKPEVELLLHSTEDGATYKWERGLTKAAGQNLARWLMETPANHMTPTIFAKNALDLLGHTDVSVEVRDKAWAEKQGMNSFLSVTRGSQEPPIFLELSYAPKETSKNKPVVIVGKGITFDSGGISLKPSKNMDRMRGDMGGAACTLASIRTAALLGLPIHIKGLIPLCENMPSGTATKPGDVVTALNGKTIQVDNTDAEGRLILADALAYAQKEFQPDVVVDIATLTGAIVVGLGSAATGVFSNSNKAWKLLHEAGHLTGDRVWRMPLWEHFSKQLDAPLADLNNIGKHSPAGGSCTAAAFLKEFIDAPHWMHLDIAGVMENSDEVPYLGKGMTGRPTRTLVEFLQLLSQGSL